MTSEASKILFLGSNVKITNLPIKEVSLLEEGSLPAYGYNPGDNIGLLAGPVTIEKGRLEQCLNWLASYLAGSEQTPLINSLSYGAEKQVYQIFRKRKATAGNRDDGWFMVNQLLPAEERGKSSPTFILTEHEYSIVGNNTGMILIDDSGVPPQVCNHMVELNPDLWCIAMGISVAYWQQWASRLGERFTLFCRLSDLETTRMEMDASVNWETIVAMCLRALRTPEVGLWDSQTNCFLCHIVVEMFPHALLYVGPKAIFFRYRKGKLPEKSSSRKRGSVPCYDTMVTAMLTMNALRSNGVDFCRNSFFDFSRQVLANWKILDDHGYHFNRNLRLPTLNFSSACLCGLPCSCSSHLTRDPFFIELPYFPEDFDKTLELAAGQ
ncbi:MAG: ATPase, partial [Candidatus Electrothrix sp. AR3]|nr:ATPase [Candidatus Electrothrix sp. AR3]